MEGLIYVLAGHPIRLDLFIYINVSKKNIIYVSQFYYFSILRNSIPKESNCHILKIQFLKIIGRQNKAFQKLIFFNF